MSQWVAASILPTISGWYVIERMRQADRSNITADESKQPEVDYFDTVTGVWVNEDNNSIIGWYYPAISWTTYQARGDY